eukprot:CAMPEP_0203861720 /NCGR_PEP_ID=MMETSP0359-20131031/13177_1 /ASSEMBLY_ACC=CAM_ASM_000338 /TAXON_ID=268821 /ORGANISM="Scrippsiella Hangoei, Strain SHTV-5" /LENGTH=181 /DNA_ID=CAMNT_0050779007 /DNA_START=98 /DNA_END=641 /DNA_ORIENTATION=+
MAQEICQYIDKKASPIVDPMVVATVLAKPELPVPFMMRWLMQNFNSAKEFMATTNCGEAELLKMDIQKLQAEIQELQDQLAPRPATAEKAEQEAQDSFVANEPPAQRKEDRRLDDIAEDSPVKIKPPELKKESADEYEEDDYEEDEDFDEESIAPSSPATPSGTLCGDRGSLRACIRADVD